MQLLSVSFVSCPCRKDTSRIVTALNSCVIDDDVDDDDDDDDDDGYMVMTMQCLRCYSGYSCCVASHTCSHHCNSDRYYDYYLLCQ